MRAAKEITVYRDGSYYVIYLAQSRPNSGNGRFALELFGLPGVGKSTVARTLLELDPLIAYDGFGAVRELSLLACLRARPLAVGSLLARLASLAQQLRTVPARKVVVAAARQLVASGKGGGTILFEEGVCHEVWRQLLRGAALSDAFIKRATRISDAVCLVEAPLETVIGRLSSKASPGPISRLLRDSEIATSSEWAKAEETYRRITNLLSDANTKTIVLSNAGDVNDGVIKLRKIVECRT